MEMNKLEEKIKEILQKVHDDACRPTHLKELGYSNRALEALSTLIQQERAEIIMGFDSMLVELWNFFALEKDHHGKQRTCGGIPSLMRLHFFLKERGLIKGSGQFTYMAKEYLNSIGTAGVLPDKAGATLNEGGSEGLPSSISSIKKEFEEKFTYVEQVQDSLTGKVYRHREFNPNHSITIVDEVFNYFLPYLSKKGTK